MGLRERWDETVAEVADLARSAGRDPADVRIIAVSKTVGPDVVAEAISAGVTDFGENRTGPFAEKSSLYPDARWHFIGTLQSNKAKAVAGRAFLVHSLDRASLLAALQRSAERAGAVQDVLVEVSVSGEESKGGIAPAELPALLEDIAASPNIACKGLMTMAPRGDSDVARRTFEGLRLLSEEMDGRFHGRDTISMRELSMGMSEDFAEAIREGATMVRIGRRIFSEDFSRPTPAM